MVLSGFRRALNAVTDIVPRHSSMVMVEDERDEFETGETMLDPALQHIAQAVRTRASRQTADDGGEASIASYMRTC